MHGVYEGMFVVGRGWSWVGRLRGGGLSGGALDLEGKREASKQRGRESKRALADLGKTGGWIWIWVENFDMDVDMDTEVILVFGGSGCWSKMGACLSRYEEVFFNNPLQLLSLVGGWSWTCLFMDSWMISMCFSFLHSFLLLFLLSPHSDFGWISRLGLVILVVVDILTL